MPDIRLISWNVNGLRAVWKKDFLEIFRRMDADVVAIQETKLQDPQLTEEMRRIDGYESFWSFSSVKKGYSGVAIYTRHEPKKVVRGYGDKEFDDEGRYLEVQLDGINVVSLYLPSGSSSEERQQAKYRCMDSFTEHLHKLRRRRSETVICGDWNIVHKEADIKNWKQNQKNSGCLPEERAWLDKVFGEYRWVDAFRTLDQEPDQYTWWSNRGQAWAKNVGWRTDCQVVTPALGQRIRRPAPTGQMPVEFRITARQACPVTDLVAPAPDARVGQ